MWEADSFQPHFGMALRPGGNPHALFPFKGWNFNGDPDGESRYELVDHEKINIRLLIGFNF